MAKFLAAFLYKKVRKPCTICAAMIWQEKYSGSLSCARCSKEYDKLWIKRNLSTYQEAKALREELKAKHKDKWNIYYKKRYAEINNVNYGKENTV